MTVAQVLLTLEDSEQRTRYLNARATLEALLALKAHSRSSTRTTPWPPPRSATATTTGWRRAWRRWRAPIAWCCCRMSTDSTRADPNRDPHARFIERVMRITPEIEAMAGRALSSVGSGGMATKIVAARIAVNAGCHMCIACRQPAPSDAPASSTVPAAPGSCRRRRRWRRASNGSPARCGRPGAIRIDAGALRALQRRQEPAAGRGHRHASGASKRGDTVSVLAPDGVEDRARHRRLFGQRRQPHHGPQEQRDRGASWAFAAARS